jgi:hypothetical protein
VFRVPTKEGLCLAAALTLSGCAASSSYSTLVTQCPCREGVEPAVVSGEPAVVSGEPAPRPGGRAREARERIARTAVPETSRRAFTTDPSAYPPIPIFNSPQWEKEHRQSERLDKQLEDTLKSVCRGC